MLQIERLETREVPSTVALLGGTLSIVGDQRDNVVLVQANPNDATLLQVQVDGLTQSFQAAAVQRLLIDGQDGNDILSSMLPAVSSTVLGGNGDDSLSVFGVTASDVVLGGNGNDRLYGITSQVGNTLIGGAGRDDILGNVNSNIVNDNADRPNVIFGQGFQVVTLNRGVLYLPTLATDDLVLIARAGNTLTVNFNGVVSTFNVNQFDRIAGVLGAGNDRAFVDASVQTDVVLYGAAGDDVLIGGSGDDLIKGGGGNDVLIGGSGNDDLTGDAGLDLIVPADGTDIVRRDAADVIFNLPRDRVIGFLQ